MNVEETKDRLNCYRPGIDDPADELFAPALSAVKNDPELASWFKEQQEFDSALRGYLKNAEIPESLLGHLKQNAGAPAFTDDAGDETEGAAAPTRKGGTGNIIFASFWTRIAAAAAALVIGFLVVHSFNSPASAVESFRGAMAQKATEGFELDHKSANLMAVRTWLASHEAPVYEECPPCIGKMKGVGCRKFEWNSHTVSVVCFERETGKIVHLFVIERAALPGIEKAGEKVPLKQQLGLETGGWMDGKNVYLLVGSRQGIAVSDLL
ncbi:MAG: hypothetical protein KDN22_07500 [Verrucomicrobiae bacterium]|nr:hypothetical protein [Verrucomicrobiae bacterium]